MEREKILLDAAYIKLRDGEPLSRDDFIRLVNLINNASWALAEMTPEIQAGLQSQLIQVLQNRFMKGNGPA